MRQISESKDLSTLNDVRVAILGEKRCIDSSVKEYEGRKSRGSSAGRTACQ